MLQSHLAGRAAVVAEARGQLEGKHELIYKMDKLMPTFYAEMDIQPGSIHDQILKDKIHDDAIAKLVGGILLAIVAIALTAVSLGTATPAVVAAGASIGAAGLGTYMAYDEYKQYAAEHAVADAGLADDPSTIMGENQGGINILRSPKWKELQLKYKPLLENQGETAYWKAVTDEFWETVNKPWLDEAIARGDNFRFVSNPNDERSLFVLTKNKKSFVLDNGKKIQSIFGREVEYLKAKGYTFKPDGTAVREP